MISNLRTTTAAAVAVSLCIASTAIAQTDSSATEPAPATQAQPAPADKPAAVATLLQGGVMGELLAINVPRSQDEIGRLIDEARRLEKTTKEEIAAGQSLATKAEDRTKIMKGELETTKSRRDAAKKEKDKAKAEQYDAIYKKQSQELKYLNELTDAVHADADRLEATRDAAAATAKSLEKELDVVHKQAELANGTPAPAAVEQYRNQLREMLESQRDAAAKATIAADKKKKVAEQRLKQLSALAKL